MIKEVSQDESLILEYAAISKGCTPKYYRTAKIMLIHGTRRELYSFLIWLTHSNEVKVVEYDKDNFDRSDNWRDRGRDAIERINRGY